MGRGKAYPAVVRDRVIDLVCAGSSLREAAVETGTSVQSAMRWWAQSGRMELELAYGRNGGLLAPVPAAVPGRRTLTSEDRAVIQAGRRQGLSHAAIGKLIDRDKSVVCREVHRNAGENGAYHAAVVHATIIGVAFGLITPSFAMLAPDRFPDVATRLVAEVVDRNADGVVTADEHEHNDHTLREIRRLSRETQSPLHRVEIALAPYIAFGIVPLFAFANAGLPFPEVPAAEWLGDPVVLGIAIGLVVGKTLGIFGASWLTVRTGLARYPAGMTQAHLLGVSMVAGVGFTVAIFVANLAFTDGDVIELAKLGIMVGSVVAGATGYLLLRLTSSEEAKTGDNAGDART